ncbi:MAG: hypothetical protein ABJO45_13535 [Lentilitoribacter sp.]
MRSAEAEVLIKRIDDLFELTEDQYLYRQFPVWGTELTSNARIFEFDWRDFNADRLDEALDSWLCISSGGFRIFSKNALKALVHNDVLASGSSVVGNFLSCLEMSPEEWLKDFSVNELDVLIACIRYMVSSSAESGEYIRILSELVTYSNS